MNPNIAEKHTPNKRRTQWRCDFQKGAGNEEGAYFFVLVPTGNNWCEKNA